MITAKIPYRASLFGGGCDYPEYYKGRGAKILSFAIDKYLYTSVASRFEDGYRVSYTETEIVEKVEDIRHDFIRGVLQHLDIKQNLEITTTGELPGGTGLGSSAAVIVGMVNALHFLERGYETYDTPFWAWEIERQLGYSPGLQDHLRCFRGGVGVISFESNGHINYQDFSGKWLENFLLFYTGRKRNSEPILSQMMNAPNIEYLDEIQEITRKVIDAIAWGEFDRLGHLLDASWKLKQHLAGGISTPKINEIYELGKSLGATGGKICGAGGGGFMVFYVPGDRELFIEEMAGEGYRHLPFKIGYREVTRI